MPTSPYGPVLRVGRLGQHSTPGLHVYEEVADEYGQHVSEHRTDWHTNWSGKLIYFSTASIRGVVKTRVLAVIWS